MDVSGIDLGRQARSLRLDTLIKLRWLAIAGQSTAIIVTHFFFHFALPLSFAVSAILMSAWLNIGLKLRFPVTQRLGDKAAFILLGFDLLQLSCLLCLSGGLENPFSVLFLAPIMIAAVSLSSSWTLCLTLFMMASASFLVFYHLPLPWYPEDPLTLPITYVGGIWLALVLGAAFIEVYAIRVADEARQLADALAATELVLAREQHLTQLDGLAAAAAHELGTPLATITLVVNEMLKLTPCGAQLYDDVSLLAQEANRCRLILSKFGTLGAEANELLSEMTLSHLLEEVAQPQREFGVAVKVDTEGVGREPVCSRNPAILYGLGNLVENATDFAKSEVKILATWSDEFVRIAIVDDGPGFSSDVLARLGEPYVTSRGGNRRFKSPEGSGLGLGLFIAKTLLERAGAVVSTANLIAPASGAKVMAAWHRSAFERGRREGILPEKNPILLDNRGGVDL